MKTVFIRRPGRTLLAAVLLAAAVFAVLSHPAVVGVSGEARELPIYCVQRDDKTVALTFDAAWGNEDTQQLIDILGKYHVRATFFVVGDWVEKYPESVKALAEAGHEVMNHSDTHPHMSRLSREEMVAEIEACSDKIEAVTGVRPTLLRPPYGEYDNTVIRTVRELGMEPIQWDVDSLDWKELPAEEICRRVTERVRPGSIVLFHNAAPHTPEALPEIIETLIGQGYSFVPVSRLILDGDYTIDSSGRQCPCTPDDAGTATLAGLL